MRSPLAPLGFVLAISLAFVAGGGAVAVSRTTGRNDVAPLAATSSASSLRASLDPSTLRRAEAIVRLRVAAGAAAGQDQHGAQSRDAIDKMRDRDLQPERIMDAIGLRPGMAVGEAGASYGYFTFKMSRRVGPAGMVYANDIAPGALESIEKRVASEKVGNIRTVLGEEADPRFPRNNLDMIVVFDCLFEFSQPGAWMKNARKYLKPDGRLVIVDPDRLKMTSAHFLSRQQIHDFARESGYTVASVDDAFLKTHMIVVLRAVP